MQIRDLDRNEVTNMLDRIHLGRLACALEGQPHVTPLFFMHDGGSLFAFTTAGQKVDWMRKNPLVCVEFEEIQSARDWSVVLVEGRYEELPESPDPAQLSARAYNLLKTRPAWWEPGCVRTRNEAEYCLETVYFRVVVTRASGRRAVPD